MAYIQITTRCNMTCDHCCYSCIEEGIDMAPEVFTAALNFTDESPALGGGEPTIHPNFWDFLWEAIDHADEYADGHVWLATNGSQTKIAKRLAIMAKSGYIGCALSQDPWHDPIDYEVVQAFTRGKKPLYPGILSPADDHDYREIRTSEKPLEQGRAAETGVASGGDGCACPTLFVTPTGDIKMCGCLDSPVIGNVMTGYSIPEALVERFYDFYLGSECYREIITQMDEEGEQELLCFMEDFNHAA